MGSKLGIIFAFLLSLAAAGGSYYLYQGWVEERTIRGGVEADLDQVKEKMDTVQAEKKQLEVKSEEYRTKAEAMQSQLQKLQSEQNRIDSEKAALESQLKEHQGMIADLQQQVTELAKKAEDARAACGVTPADLKADPFAPQPFEGTSASSVTSESGTGTSSLVFQPTPPGGVVSSGAAAPVPGVTEVSSTVAAAAPAAAMPFGAKVLTVNRKYNFVVVNQGLQDGLQMGDRLRVLKQGQEVATIQVEKLYDKFSAATLLEEDPNQQVVEGDEIRKI